jgi:hypothetical protein
VTDPGIFKIGHQIWQRANVTAAAAYLREVLAGDPGNTRVKVLYEGLLDVMEPTRRARRHQRELAVVEAIARERRGTERRGGCERRHTRMELPAELERRSGTDRRLGKDRRKP